MSYIKRYLENMQADVEDLLTKYGASRPEDDSEAYDKAILDIMYIIDEQRKLGGS